MLYETTRICEDIGDAAATGHGTVEQRPDDGRGVPSGRDFDRLRFPLASSHSRGRTGSAGGKTGPWPATKAPEAGMSAVAGTAAERGHGLRLSQRTVDAETHRPGGPPGVRRPVSSQPCVAGVAGVALVLPGARTPARAAGRGSDRTLEAIQVAAYKKTPANLGPIWRSLMKAAFCSFRRADGRGARKVRPPRFPTAISTTASRPWRSLRSARSAGALACTPDSNRTTSRPCTWPRSCDNFCTTCQGRSSWYGTKGKFTRVRRSRESCWTTLAFRRSSFPSMPRSSIRPSRSGTTSKATRPIASRWTNRISETVFMPINAGLDVPKKSFVPLFWRRSCHHLSDRVYLHYFCEAQ